MIKVKTLDKRVHLSIPVGLQNSVLVTLSVEEANALIEELTKSAQNLEAAEAVARFAVNNNVNMES